MARCPGTGVVTGGRPAGTLVLKERQWFKPAGLSGTAVIPERRPSRATPFIWSRFRPKPVRPARKQRMSADPDAKRVLLFTSSLGFGHMRATQAIERALEACMPEATVRTLDLWSLMDYKVAEAVRTAYLRLVQEHADLYDQVYQLDQSTWRSLLESSRPLPPELSEIMKLVPTRFQHGAGEWARPAGHSGHSGHSGQFVYPTDRMLLRLLTAVLSADPRSTVARSRLARLALVQRSWARLSGRFVNYVRRFSPDVMVATQMNPAALLSAAKRSGRLRVPAIGVLTDFGVHDFWIQSGIDLYCLAHESFADLRSAGVSADRVITTGIPLMPGFAQPPDARQARLALGLDPDARVILVAGGGLGLGVDSVVRALLEHAGSNGTTGPGAGQPGILVTVGRNDNARKAMDDLASRYPARMRVWHWTEQMECLIRAADVVVGKPGGLTVAEVLACGRPLIASHGLRGQEGFNSRFLETFGAGLSVPEEQLVDTVLDLLHKTDALARMQFRALALGRRDGARRIALLVRDFHARRQQGRLSSGVPS